MCKVDDILFHATDLVENLREDQHINRFQDMCIVGALSHAFTNLDYIHDQTIF